jgi:hypothetical protein
LGRGEIAEAELVGQANDKVVEDGHDFRLLRVGDAGAVFLEGGVASIMQAVFNALMVSG